jgi:hypothetical protein
MWKRANHDRTGTETFVSVGRFGYLSHALQWVLPYAPLVEQSQFAIAWVVPERSQRGCSQQPKVHRVPPVTSIVHCTSHLFIGNHEKLAIYDSPANAGQKFFMFFGLFRLQNRKVTITWCKIVQFTKVWNPSPEPLVIIVQ